MSSSIEQTKIVECPICYDEIDVLKNCVTTECGHQFHCNCLMKNSATNGFSCPMCRSVMAEEPESESEDEELSEYEDYEEDEAFDDNVLTSFRMFHQQLAGEEVEEEPLQEEQDQDQDQAVEEPIIKPSAETIATRLVAQGFTMEDMVKCFLIDHEEYESEAEINERFADRMFGKFRQIISNYPREQREAEEAAQRQPRHGSSRLRECKSVREDVEDCFAELQNRYQLLSNEGDSEDDEEV